MKDPKNFAKDKLIKRAPKGVDPAKHERCVHDVKRQGHSVGSAHAICTASMEKADVSSRSSSDKKLATKIIHHNKKKLHSFVQSKMKKSVDFKDTTVSIESQDQMLAEKTTSPALIEYITNNLGVLKSGPGASVKIPFPTGTLTMSEREAGIYHGHFQDQSGQIIEKFDSQTVAIIAKTLQIKSLIPVPVEQVSQPIAPAPVDPNPMDTALAAHNRIDDLQRQIIEQQRGKSIRVKYGDFEIEIKKSIRDFVNDFKYEKTPEKDLVRKAISSWRKKHSSYISLPSDQAAAKELITNWNAHQESFFQFVDALSRGDEDEQY